jgi:hypothetical protein
MRVFYTKTIPYTSDITDLGHKRSKHVILREGIHYNLDITY